MVRQCFLTGELIFFAEERARRPQNFKKLHVESTPEELCPFCPENSFMTPKEIFSTPDKSIRIVPNKYPFVSKNDPNHYGVHDVLIDTGNHFERLYQFNDKHITEVMKTIKKRAESLQKDKRTVYIQIFKNDGIDAGASQSHSHWQIAALSVVPPKYKGILKTLLEYHDKNGKCYFCSLKDTVKDQLIEENGSFISYVPIDSKFPYEMYILPKKHISNIVYFNSEELAAMGKILRNCVRRLAALNDGISYNICFFSSPKVPPGECYDEYTHFHIQIIPRIGHMAGFEFSTGCYINSVLPENAALTLKQADIIKSSEGGAL